MNLSVAGGGRDRTGCHLFSQSVEVPDGLVGGDHILDAPLEAPAETEVAEAMEGGPKRIQEATGTHFAVM